MPTRMILSIAFVFFVVLGMVVYVLNDNSRAATTFGNQIEHEAEAGSELFAANCSQCHGPKGEGAIGPALDREEWHAGSAKYDDVAVSDFLKKVLYRGQYSPQPGIQMPAWHRDFGGPFNDQQLEDVIRFITHGEWNSVLSHTAAPNFLADIPATQDQKKQFPATSQDVLKVKNPEKYGGANPEQAQKDLLAADIKAEDAAKGAAYQEAQANAEKVRVLLGNRDPKKPTEQLNGMKQLLQLKGCIGCHGFGSAGTTLGPNLTEVGSRRSSEWMYKWIQNPSAVADKDRGPNILPWFTEDKRTEYWPMGPTYMPTIQMTDEERKRIVDYLSGLKTTAVAAPRAQATENK